MKIEMQSLTHKMQRAAVGKLVDAVLAHAASDRAGTVSQLGGCGTAVLGRQL